MAKKKVNLIVEQDAETIEKTVLARAIVEIGAAMRKLNESGLNRKAIVVLVQHKTHCYFKDIEAIFDALDSLKKDYCN